jgi:hypothetical protein
MSPSLPALDFDGLKYVVGESTAEFTASDNGPHRFPRNVVSFGGKVCPVTSMRIRTDGLSGGYRLVRG